MIMGYAGQLEECPRLTADERRKVSVIVRQCTRMRDLVNDLNLASRLEYDMQPLNRTRENAVAIARQVAVDFINMDVGGKYSIEWKTSPEITDCPVSVDKNLICRAISNLIQNCINHNADGCTIYVSVLRKNPWEESGNEAPGDDNDSMGNLGACILRVEDDGTGMLPETLHRLNSTSHYMMCDSNAAKQQHGLGLLIVRQIAKSHGGDMRMCQSAYGGLCVDILLPFIPAI